MYRTLSTLILLLILPVAVMAHGPSRQKVTKEITLNAPAVMVWDLISDFCSIVEWHPAVVDCEGRGGNEPGATRILTIGEPGGAQIHEELQKFDSEKMVYKYKITQTDNAVLPVITYSAFLSVKDNGDDTSTITWRGGFYRAYPKNEPPPELNDEAAVTAVTGVYETGLEGIKDMIEN
jgi:uncharacterized protein YndB with AHSA1/START domain